MTTFCIARYHRYFLRNKGEQLFLKTSFNSFLLTLRHGKTVEGRIVVTDTSLLLKYLAISSADFYSHIIFWLILVKMVWVLSDGFFFFMKLNEIWKEGKRFCDELSNSFDPIALNFLKWFSIKTCKAGRFCKTKQVRQKTDGQFG